MTVRCILAVEVFTIDSERRFRSGVSGSERDSDGYGNGNDKGTPTIDPDHRFQDRSIFGSNTN